MTTRTKRIVDEIAKIISRACPDRQIAELMNVPVSVNDDDRLSDLQWELGGRLFERLTQLRPDCVEAAATMTSPDDTEIEIFPSSDHMTDRELEREVEGLLGKPFVDPVDQDQTDWTPMSVPSRENADGTETPTSWFAYNRTTHESVRFAGFDEAKEFCFHPDNRR